MNPMTIDGELLLTNLLEMALVVQPVSNACLLVVLDILDLQVI